MSGPKPLVAQTTPWRRDERHDVTFNGAVTKAWRRTVADGRLMALVGQEYPIGWHLSISFRDDCGNHSRYPHWDEITHARYELLPDDATFAILLPPKAGYVACHPTTFHLHQVPETIARMFA